MTAAYVIHGGVNSGNCLKVKWTAEKLAIPYEWIETDVFKRQSRTPEFLALNPSGQVPIAVFPDGRVLAQSNAIILHFAEGSALIPRDAYERAKMLEWMFWEQYSHEPYVAVRISRKHYLGKSDEELDPALLTRGNEALDRLEMQLEATPFLVGDALSLADIALVAYTRKAELGGFSLSHYPNVTRWIARVERELGLTPGVFD
jgi:glutathione S-transferase